jgi:hypothetical protein
MSMLADAIQAAGRWLDRQEREADRRDRAVEALLRALNLTTAYLADSDDGRERRRSREHELVELWTKAAAEMRRRDPGLARRLEMKALYWANPTHWTDQDIDLARIRIRDITRLARGDLFLEPGE